VDPKGGIHRGKLHNDELHSLYSLPSIVRVIKSMIMRWAKYVARMGMGELFTVFRLRVMKVRGHWEDLQYRGG
jgi:hypothetical protein